MFKVSKMIIIAASLVLISDLENLLGYLSTTLALSSAVTVGTLLLPSKGRLMSAIPNRGSTMVWICALTYVGSTMVIAMLMTINDPKDLIATAVTVLIGTVLWVITRRTRIPKVQ